MEQSWVYTISQFGWLGVRMATYDTGNLPAMRISICFSTGHKTVKNFQKTGAFTVSMADAKHVVACDYVGIVSGNDVADKMEKAGFTVTKSELVNVSVDESVMTDGKLIR